ncbi:MAG: hypothetical protein AAGI23_05125 [Bacteroidota bacterium]
MKYPTILLLLLLIIGCQEEDIIDPAEKLPPCEAVIAADSISPNNLTQIMEDMSLPHEAVPNGVRDQLDWKYQPRLAWGNEPDTTWSAMIPWGQIYRDQSPLVVSNTRIQIANMKAYYLSRSTNEWIEWVTTSSIEGAAYREDFVNDASVPTAIREEEVGISIKLLDGYNFHFWSADGRVTMNPKDIKGVWVGIDARLIGDSNVDDDSCHANFMMSVGADYWKSLSAEWDQWMTNGDIGIGRFRYITPHWQTFNMHSLTEAELRENPPPF